MRRVTELDGGWCVYSTPVANGLNARPSYALLLLTQHPDGWWNFNEACSIASGKWRAFCFEQSGRLDLDPVEDREKQWVDTIAENLERRLAAGPFLIGAEMSDVYGATLGEARAMHVRRAVKELHARGVTPTDGKGDVQRMKILTPRRDR